MAYKALIVDDDPNVRDEVGEILDSMGHEHDDAACQEEARELLAGNQYSYHLLDLEIPVRTGRGLPRIQNGENLLGEILRQRGTRREPVIVITGHGKEGPGLGVRMMRLGAADYVNKPFPSTGRTLDIAIREALVGGKHVAPGQASSFHKPFKGGELVFYKYRVELCGVKICGGGNLLIRRILDALKQKRPNGKYVAYSGHELAAEVGCPAEVNRIAGAIRDFRRDTMHVGNRRANRKRRIRITGTALGPSSDSTTAGPPYLTSRHRHTPQGLG